MSFLVDRSHGCAFLSAILPVIRRQIMPIRSFTTMQTSAAPAASVNRGQPSDAKPKSPRSHGTETAKVNAVRAEAAAEGELDNDFADPPALVAARRERFDFLKAMLLEAHLGTS